MHVEHDTNAWCVRIYARMKAANDPKYLQTEQNDAERLESRAKKSNEAHVEAPAEVPTTAAADPSSHALDATGADVSAEPLSAEEGIEAEDTSFLDNLYNDPEATNEDSMPASNDSVDPEAMDEPNHADDSADMQAEPQGSGDYEMTTDDMSSMLVLMDTLQPLGVDAVAANRFAAAVLRETPAFMKFYGRGSMVQFANTRRRDLNVLGKHALDLSTFKPSGEAWDFTLAADRDEARQLVETEEPNWVMGCHPCTAFTRLMQINFQNPDAGKD